MRKAAVVSARPVVLLGPAPFETGDFDAALAGADTLVAADGAAGKALELNRLPDLVIGDFDSLAPDPRLPADRLLHVPEQDSTDFEKCLDRIEAPRVLAFGFLGRRFDHTLAVLSALAARPPGRCVLYGEHDVVVHCPSELQLDLAPGLRLSLFPMAPVSGRSTGLEWPIDGLDFAPSGRIGTSNRTTGPVGLHFDGPGMLLVLPRVAAPELIPALPSC